MDEVAAALREQIDELHGLAGGLDEAGFAGPSACDGWSISDVLLHLAQTNDMATASVRGDFEAATATWRHVEGAATVDDVAEVAVVDERGATGAEVFARWGRSADEMVAAFAAADPAARVPWVVGLMAARTLCTTRIAETWIHTTDVADGLGVTLVPGARLWHVARLVHRTIPYAFERAGEAPPGPVRFVLDPPGDDGASWDFGADHAATVVRGPALDLCRVAGQRCAAAETALTATGPDADRVLALVRTFA